MSAPPIVQGYTDLLQQLQICLENNPGEQLLLPETASSPTLSLITQPNTVGAATTGMHLHLYIIGPNNSTGAVQITGTDPNGNPLTSANYQINAAPLTNLGYVELTTKEAFAAVNANGIAITNLANASFIIYGCPAGKILVPMTTEAEEHQPKFAPQDKRGILWKTIRTTVLTKKVTIDKLDGALYPGPSSLWLAYMLVSNNPAITTVPATPSTLLAATTKAATMTLTSAPKNPGQFLIFTPAAKSVAGTIVLSGLDIYGNAQSETITVGANNTPVYSSKRYSALTSPGTNEFTTTGLSAAATIAVTGVFAWVYTFTNDGVNVGLFSATLSFFDGVIGKLLPYTILTEGTFDWQKEKDIAFTGKGEAQDYLLVGGMNATQGGVNPFATLAQPTEVSLVSWPGTFYVDNLPGGVPFTTQDGSFLTFKLQLMTGQKPFYVGDGMQRWSNVTRDFPDFAFDATVVFQNYQNDLDFKQNNKKVFGVQFQGNLLGSINSTNYFEYWKWTLPARYDTYKPDSSKNPVEVAIKGLSEYDFGLGYAYQLAVCAQVPPTYTN